MKVYSHSAVVHGSHAGKSKSYLFTLTILIQLAFQGFVIRPGHENLVAMGAVSTIADDEIISVPAKKRNCYFQEEYKLELHRWVMEMLVVLVIILLPRLYSQSGCVFECKMAMGRAKTIGGCTPWFYPSKGRVEQV